MSDRDELDDYFHASRYLSRRAFAKYGFDASLYDEESTPSIERLKGRLVRLLQSGGFVEPKTGDALRQMLGNEFSWVRSSLDVVDATRIPHVADTDCAHA